MLNKSDSALYFETKTEAVDFIKGQTLTQKSKKRIFKKCFKRL